MLQYSKRCCLQWKAFHSKMAGPPAAYDVITIVTDHHQTFLKMSPLQKTSGADVYRLENKNQKHKHKQTNQERESDRYAFYK